MTSERMREGETTPLWSARGADYALSEPHRHGPDLPGLLALARPAPDDICLDVGTGTGHTAALLARHTKAVVGLDPAEGMLRAARESYGGLANLRFVTGYAHATGFPGAHFDLVTARHTAHHFESVPAFLLEAARVLKPGGRLVVVDEVTPHPGLDPWYDRLERLRDESHVRAYTVQEWRDLIAASPLAWVVGDAHTTLNIDVSSWLARMRLSDERARAVRNLLEEAPPLARSLLNFTGEGEVLSFEMPLALILAVKPDEKEPNG